MFLILALERQRQVGLHRETLSWKKNLITLPRLVLNTKAQVVFLT